MFPSVTENPPSFKRVDDGILDMYNSALKILDDALVKVRRNSSFSYIFMSAAFLCLVSTMDSDYQSGAAPRWAMLAVRTFLVAFMVWCIWMAVIMSRIELNSLLATRSALQIDLNWKKPNSQVAYSKFDAQ